MATDSSENKINEQTPTNLVKSSLSTSIRAGSVGISRASVQADEQGTVIQQCVDAELRRYFNLLDGQAPHDLHRMVMSQVESCLLKFVLEECGNNQTRAAEYLGISRGTLRSRIAEHQLQD